ncbi:hypothetical protein DFP72DRAFT_3207 [Ephemerocybe angulata]|uniref:Uncharacterized protein n=1 Tax=Ephemerocybe angulata TaxID=980116 RepID=A0A8H6MGN9_9AGAR|nr:hypothetical protein DFP72DRAFT_3207 [Tulosesus angulatus]
MDPSTHHFSYSFTYPTSNSPAASCSGTSSSESSSARTPPPPYAYEPQLDLAQRSQKSYSSLTTTVPFGESARYHTITERKVTRRLQIPHPYARLALKKGETKRRKIWNHALEKSLFSPFEISTLGAPHRRGIYTASLESHIDELHARLLSIGYWPVPFEELDPFKGLNSKTAKSMVANLQHEASVSKLKLLELERANQDLQTVLKQ